VPAPDIDVVAVTNFVKIYAIRQAETREQCVAQALVGREPSDVHGDALARVDPADVIVGRRDVPPARSCASRMRPATEPEPFRVRPVDRKSTRLNSSHSQISYAVFCLK